MVNGPPCPTCGTPLRWHPDHNAWGCDRCQRMIAATPYAPVAAPQQQPYHPIPAQPHAVAPVSSTKPPGSKKALWIVLALLVVGGGAAAMFLLKGGGVSGGAGSRDGLVDQTIVAMNAGDGPGLYALAMDESRADEFMDCDEKDRDRDKDKQKERAERHKKRALEEAGKLAADSKGKGLAVDATTENDEGSKRLAVKKGETLKGCTAKVDVATHDLEVAAHDGNSKKLLVRVQAIEIDGRWFLAKEPRIKEASSGGSAEVEVKTVAPSAPPASMPPPAADPLPPVVSSDGIPQSCQDYQAAMEKLANCDKLPQASRDGMKQGFDMMKKSWAQLKNLPASAQKSIDDACKQGVDAMKQMSALGC